jgi:fido (protein-threonine AMPylation protein)
MKYINKKLIKGQFYYYFEYYLRFGKKKYKFTRYLGTELPEDLSKLMKQYFDEIAEFVLDKLNVGNYFLQENLKRNERHKFLNKNFHLSECPKGHIKKCPLLRIELARFRYILLNHELFEKDFKLFKTLFYILFVLNSNRAEGSKVTQADIEKVMARKVKPKTMIGREIINSITAINFAFSDGMKWNNKSIKKIHKLMFFDMYPAIAGDYKKVDNVVNNSPTTKWEEVPKEVRDLLKWLRKNKKKMYPAQLALEFHWRFEAIHPFEDGNGRVGRILLNSLLVELGYAPVIYFSDNHKSYCNAIALALGGHTRQLTKHYVESVKKSERAIEKYKKEGIIGGGSPKVGRWEIQKGKIRLG